MDPVVENHNNSSSNVTAHLKTNSSLLQDYDEDYPGGGEEDNTFDFIFEGFLLTLVTLFGIVANLIAMVVLLRKVKQKSEWCWKFLANWSQGYKVEVIRGEVKIIN